MKTLILILLFAITVDAQSTRYDKFTGVTYIESKEVEVYRNRGGLLLYLPDRVTIQALRSDEIDVLVMTVGSSRSQFLDDCTIRLLLDGTRRSLNCRRESYRVYASPTLHVNEILSVKLGADDVLAFLASSRLEMQVGMYQFVLKPKHITELKKVLLSNKPTMRKPNADEVKPLDPPFGAYEKPTPSPR